MTISTDYLTKDQLKAMAKEYQRQADNAQRSAAELQRKADRYRKAWRKRVEDERGQG